MKAVAIITCIAAVGSFAILCKFAQVGLEVQGAAEEAKSNPLKAFLGLFRASPQ